MSRRVAAVAVALVVLVDVVVVVFVLVVVVVVFVMPPSSLPSSLVEFCVVFHLEEEIGPSRNLTPTFLVLNALLSHIWEIKP